MLQLPARPQFYLIAAEQVDRSLVVLVQMGLGPPAEDDEEHVPFGGGAAALASFRLQDSEAARAGPRNVLWMITDDQPQYMMESLTVTTDNFRDLGIEFALGSADVPLCGPARVSLLTGLSVTTHKCDTNRTWSKFFNSTLGLQERTVACYVKDVGYATGHFGKYVNGYANDGTVPPHWDRRRATKGDASDAGGNVTTPNQGNVDGTWIEIIGPLCVGGRAVCGVRA